MSEKLEQYEREIARLTEIIKSLVEQLSRVEIDYCGVHDRWSECSCPLCTARAFLENTGASE